MNEQEGTRINYVVGRDDLQRLTVIVEGWDRLGRSGSRRRRYNAEFDEKERATIARYYPIVYKWYLVKGYPQGGALMHYKTWHLLCRAADFFASI